MQKSREITVTQHARHRLRIRGGRKGTNADAAAKRAFAEGITHSETRGSLNRYLTHLYFQHQSANNIRIYGNLVYLFRSVTLVTVLPLPVKYEAVCAKIRHRRWQPASRESEDEPPTKDQALPPQTGNSDEPM